MCLVQASIKVRKPSLRSPRKSLEVLKNALELFFGEVFRRTIRQHSVSRHKFESDSSFLDEFSGEEETECDVLRPG